MKLRFFIIVLSLLILLKATHALTNFNYYYNLGLDGGSTTINNRLSGDGQPKFYHGYEFGFVGGQTYGEHPIHVRQGIVIQDDGVL